MSLKLSIAERLGKDVFELNGQPHILVNSQICREKCLEKPCLYFCPADLFKLNTEGDITHDCDGCLECGTCRVGCPHEAVTWDYPEGGYGVSFRFG
ncbi:MAG TPA: 4Fe-4S dicluster domain-containing protein [bacterium]|nr:4Fe-4S dicluster domain-containing protein [bacterium]